MARQNPRQSRHEEAYWAAAREMVQAQERSYKLFPADFAGAFNASLDWIKYAAIAMTEAGYMGATAWERNARKDGVKAMEQARHYIRVAQDVAAQGYDPYRNPAAIMEARADVDNAGALCRMIGGT